MRFRDCKRGSMEDMIVLIVIILFSTIGIFIGYTIFTNVVNVPVIADFNETYVSQDSSLDFDVVINKLNNTFLGLDKLFLLFIMLMFGVILVLSFVIPSHPIFLIFGFIIYIFSIWLSAIVSNMIERFQSISILSDSSTSFPIITYFLSHLPYFIGVMGAIVLIVLYGRSRTDVQQI